jgi:F-type H+-transporting ATPase subunit b
MPRLFHEQEFWILIAALILLAIVWKRARGALIGTLDARSERIRTELDEARQLHEEARQLLAAYQQKEREARAEAQAIIAHATGEAERIARQAAHDLEQSLARRQRLAEERIAPEEARAVAEIRAIAVDIAIDAARQVIRAGLDERRGAEMIDAAIAALPQQFH